MLLHHHFIRTAKRYSSKLAFIDYTSDRKITYSQALIASLIFTGKIRMHKGEYIGIMIPNSAACAFVMLGTVMAGKTPVMINYSTGTEQNIKNAENICGLQTIITSRAFIEKIKCPVVESMVFIEDIVKNITFMDKLKAALIARLPVPFILRQIHTGYGDDNAAILFTSGSEKIPKAVQLTHQNILSNIKSFGFAVNLSDNDIMLSILPLFHIFGLNVNFWTPLLYGMTSITYANPVDYKKICAILKKEKPTIMAATPSFLWGYLRTADHGDFSSFRIIVSGADKCPDTLRNEFLEKHNIVLYEGYGATETSPVISVNTPENNKPGSVGKPLHGVEVRIVQHEAGTDCSAGEAGRIKVKGKLVMKGYFKDPEATANVIQEGWYDTGDVGYLDKDGFLWHSGRLKRFVKIGGEMVSLIRVEAILEQCLPQDVNCCVIDIPDNVKGAKIVAAVTKEIDEQQILKKMAEDLPNIALPKKFIVIDELPKTGSGKVNLRLISEIVKEKLLR